MPKRREYELGTQGLYLTFTKKSKKYKNQRTIQYFNPMLLLRGLNIRRGRK